MKKIYLTILLSLIVLSSVANIYVPRAYISELYVDSLNNWVIEIGFYERDFLDEFYTIDSITLETSSGSARLISYTLIPGGGTDGFDSIALITVANLDIPLTINRSGDFIKLKTYYYYYDYYKEEALSFGNYPGSMLSCIHNGESITRINNNGYNNFAICKSPSIGYNNNLADASGTLEGIFYQPDGMPFGEGKIILFITRFNYSTNIYPYASITIQPDGSFSENMFARNFHFDTLLYYPAGSNVYQAYSVIPVNECFRPDTVIYKDIIATGYVEGIASPESNFENAVILSPNPFADKVTFYFNLKTLKPDDKLTLSIFDAGGKEIEKIKISPEQTRYDWTPEKNIAGGIYIYHLTVNTKNVKSGKLIKK